jgi:dolichol-phosphate mannosyltransferase
MTLARRENNQRPLRERRRRMRHVHIVLPAFNEAHRIGTLLDRIDEVMYDDSLDYTVIILDDGSTDRTAEIVATRAKRMPIVYRKHEMNRGLGSTIRDGLLEAMRTADARDIIITMDSDDTHTPGLVLRMVHMIREGYDVIIASRYQHEARVVGVPIMRQLLSLGASLLMRVVFPIRGVKDYTCGYRAYRAEVLQRARERFGERLFDQDGFQCMVDILLKLRTMHLIFGEVPFILRYDYKEGGTKMKVFATVRKTLLLLIRRRLGKW